MVILCYTVKPKIILLINFLYIYTLFYTFIFNNVYTLTLNYIT